MVFSKIKKRKRWRENTKRPWLWSYILFFCGDYLWYGLNNWRTCGCFESFDQARLSLYKLIWNWFALVGLVKTSLTRHVFIKPSIVGGMDIEPVVYQLLNIARLHHLWTSEIVLKHLKPYWILNTFLKLPFDISLLLELIGAGKPSARDASLNLAGVPNARALANVGLGMHHSKYRAVSMSWTLVSHVVRQEQSHPCT